MISTFNKWKKEIAIRKNPKLTKHLPQTDRLRPDTLKLYLNQYPIVFLKPLFGRQGRGIIKISIENSNFQLQSNDVSENFTDIITLENRLHHFTGDTKYIIQQGIDLISIENHVIDFRVLLLKPQNVWEYMGVMGRMASENSIVTNFTRGGQPVSLNHVILKSSIFSNNEIKEIEKSLSTLGMETAITLNNTFPSLRRIGVDIGIDSNKELWILDLNLSPMYKLFKHHPDPTLYRKIRTHTRNIKKDLQ